MKKRTDKVTRSVQIAIAALAVFLSHSHGATTPKDASLSADFSAAFDQFFQFGLPDSKGARFVTIGGYESSSGWLLSEDTDTGRAQIIVAQTRIAKCVKTANATTADSYNPSIDVTDWTPYDLEKHLDELIKEFEKELDQKLKSDSSYFYGQHSRNGADYLLLAAHAHRNNLNQKANRLAYYIFATSREPEATIRQALHSVANARYKLIIDQALEKGVTSWSQAATDINTLVGQFGKNWALSSGASLLATKIQNQSANSQPPAVLTPNLDPESRELIQTLSRASSRELFPPPSPDENEDDEEDDEEDETNSAENSLWVLAPPAATPSSGILTNIKSRGIKSIPMLLALLDDEFLLPVSNENLDDYNDDSWDGDLDEIPESPEDAYMSLYRPISRGEIARHLLRPLVTMPESSDFSEVPADIAMLARNWYNTHKDDSPLQLARHYFKSGSQYHASNAIPILLKSGEASDSSDIEKYLLDLGEDESTFDRYQLVSSYLKIRGKDGKDLLTQYESISRKRYAEESGGGLLQSFSTNSQLKRYFAPLHDLVNPRGLDEILADIREGRKSLSESYSLISTKLEEMDDEERLASSLKIVNDPSNSYSLRSGILSQMTQSIDWESQKESNIPQSIATSWHQALADTTVDPSAVTPQKLTIGDTAAWVIEAIYGAAKDTRKVYSLYDVDWRGAIDLIRKRATMRVDNLASSIDFPKLPSIDDVPEDQRDALWQRLLDLPADPKPYPMDGFTFSELLVIQQRINSTRSRDSEAPAEFLPPDTAKRLAPLTLRVTSFKAPDTFSALVDKYKDQPLNTQLVTDLLEKLREEGKSGHLLTAVIVRHDLLRGCTIEVRPTPVNQLSEQYVAFLRSRSEEFGDPAPSFVYGYTSNRSSAAWNDDAPDSEKNNTGGDDDALDSDEDDSDSYERSGESKTRFWEHITQILEAKDQILNFATITFYAVPADAFKDTPETSP